MFSTDSLVWRRRRSLWAVGNVWWWAWRMGAQFCRRGRRQQFLRYRFRKDCNVSTFFHVFFRCPFPLFHWAGKIMISIGALLVVIAIILARNGSTEIMTFQWQRRGPDATLSLVRMIGITGMTQGRGSLWHLFFQCFLGEVTDSLGGSSTTTGWFCTNLLPLVPQREAVVVLLSIFSKPHPFCCRILLPFWLFAHVNWGGDDSPISKWFAPPLVPGGGRYWINADMAKLFVSVGMMSWCFAVYKVFLDFFGVAREAQEWQVFCCQNASCNLTKNTWPPNTMAATPQDTPLPRIMMRLFMILLALGIWGPFCAMIAAAGIWVVKVCFMDFAAYLLLIFDRFCQYLLK